MKCRLQVSPLWKNPAANGPWYQVESNPVIPVERCGFASAAKWTRAIAAISSATSVGTESLHPRPSRRREGMSAPAPSRYGWDSPPCGERGASFHRAAEHGADQRADTAPARRAPKLPSSSATQSRSASASTAVARCAGAPSNRGSSRARSRRRPQPGEPDQQGQLGDAQQVAAGAEHLAAAAAGA